MQGLTSFDVYKRLTRQWVSLGRTDQAINLAYSFGLLTSKERTSLLITYFNTGGLKK